MGIKNLRKFLKKSAPAGVSNINLFTKYAGSALCIDVNSYLYKMAYNKESKGRNYYLKGFTQIISDFLSHDILPIFIFDGCPPTAKDNTLGLRQQAKEKKIDNISTNHKKICDLLDLSITTSNEEIEKAVSTALDTDRLSAEDIKLLSQFNQEINKNKKNIISVTKDMYANLEKLFNLWGVPWMRAKGEADFLCARLVIDKVAAATISEDMDIIAHGASKLLTGFMSINYNRTNEVEQFDLSIILSELHLTYEQFIDFCILSGCDYCDTLYDIGPMKGYQLILQYVDLEHFPATLGNTEKIIAARAEFYKSSLEDYDLSKLKLKPVKEVELTEFLLENTSYRATTLNKKISSIKTA